MFDECDGIQTAHSIRSHNAKKCLAMGLPYAARPRNVNVGSRETSPGLRKARSKGSRALGALKRAREDEEDPDGVMRSAKKKGKARAPDIPEPQPAVGHRRQEDEPEPRVQEGPTILTMDEYSRYQASRRPGLPQTPGTIVIPDSIPPSPSPSRSPAFLRPDSARAKKGILKRRGRDSPPGPADRGPAYTDILLRKYRGQMTVIGMRYGFPTYDNVPPVWPTIDAPPPPLPLLEEAPKEAETEIGIEAEAETETETEATTSGSSSWLPSFLQWFGK